MGKINRLQRMALITAFTIILFIFTSCSKAKEAPASKAEEVPVSKVAEEPAIKADKQPQKMPEESVDQGTKVHIVKWYPCVKIFDLTAPWSPTVSDKDGLEVHTEPSVNSPIAGVIPQGSQLEIIGYETKKIVNEGDPRDENAKPYSYYQTYFKVKSGSVEGWHFEIGIEYPEIISSYYGDIPPSSVAYVRFTGPLPVLREGPSLDAPKTTADLKVEKNIMCEVTARIDNWLYISSYGWLAANSLRVEFYYLLFWCTPGGELFSFYFPINKEISKLYYEVERLVTGRPYSDKQPVFSVITTNGETIQGKVKKKFYWELGQSGSGEYEVKLPKIVLRDEITQITFAVGQGDKRFSYTVDPRKAWAEQ